MRLVWLVIALSHLVTELSSLVVQLLYHQGMLTIGGTAARSTLILELSGFLLDEL